MLHLVGIRQVILYVTDMAKSVEFYEKTFDLSHVYPSESADWGSEKWVTMDAGEFSLALHAGGSGVRNADFDLVFYTDNIESVHEQLVARGAECTGINRPHPGVAFFSLKDPDGFSITISQS